MVFGDGCIDFREVYQLLLKYDYFGWIVVEVEQDFDVVNLFEYVLIVRNYIDEQLLDLV